MTSSASSSAWEPVRGPIRNSGGHPLQREQPEPLGLCADISRFSDGDVPLMLRRVGLAGSVDVAHPDPSQL